VTEKMNPEVKELWLAALRSGEYKQGRQRLRTDDEFCCLGVLCDLAVKAGAVDGFDDGGWYLPDDVATWAGLEDAGSGVRIDENWALIDHNDGNDGPPPLKAKSFKQIANLIEKRL